MRSAPIVTSAVLAMACGGVATETNSAPASVSVASTATPVAQEACGACAVGRACVDGRCERVRTLVASDSACARTPQGEVWCWGASDWVDPLLPPPAPHKIEVGEPAVSLAALSQDDGFCAITASGNPHCWRGGSKYERKLPADVVDLVFSPAGSCGLLRTGRVVCVGPDDSWVEKYPSARALPDFGDRTMIGSQSDPFCVITNGGTVDCWNDFTPKYSVRGLDSIVQINIPRSSLEPSLAIAADGKAWRFDATPPGTTPTEAEPVPGFGEVMQLSAGYGRFCVLRKDGSVWCGGEGESGELGNRHRTASKLAKVEGIPAATQVSAGDGFTCAQTIKGEVWCWGSRIGGKMGDGFPREQATGVKVAGVANAVEVVSSLRESCALLRDGQITCWGEQIDPAAADAPDRATAQPVEGLQARRLLSSGYGVCAVEKDGALACFEGGLPRRPATRYANLGEVSALFINEKTAVALRRDGQVVAFSAGAVGSTVTDAPFKHPELRDVSAISFLDGRSACALRAGGKLTCFTIRTEADTKPKDVVGKLHSLPIPGGATLLPGRDAVCLRAKDGTASCFDYKLHSALHPRAPEARMLRGKPVPPKAVPPPPEPELVAVAHARDAIAYERGCALSAAGRVVCTTGWSGNGRTTDRGLTDVVQISAYINFGCAVDKGGSVFCWGENDKDQLGSEASPFAFVPVKVPIPGL